MSVSSRPRPAPRTEPGHPPRGPRRLRLALALGILVLVGILAAGCGGAQSGTQSAASQSGQSGGNGATSVGNGPQYLIKSLDVDLAVKDTGQVATEIEGWIAATDPRSETAGIDYEQTDSGFYHVSVSFSVQATLYPQVERYLADYAGQHNGKLLSLHETVQDVTNDYVDTQSRLANLRAEQQRLQALMSQAGSLSDVLALDQQLTNVEGQIEQIEAHLNELNSETTFYRVTVSLEPLEDAVVAAGAQFDPGGTFVNAAHAALVFGEFLITLAIWLLVFSVFVIPPLAIWLLIRRARRRRQSAVPPPPRPSAWLPAPVPARVAAGAPRSTGNAPTEAPGPASPSVPPSGPPARPTSTDPSA